MEQPQPTTINKVKNYEKLYYKEKERNDILEKKLQQKNNELDKLKLLLKSKKKEIEDNKEKLLSYTNSKTAKNGYNEEILVCEDLNNELIKKVFIPMLGNYNECNRITGNNKCDVQSNNKILRGQVKKYKKGQFQQLDRHWTSCFI